MQILRKSLFKNLFVNNLLLRKVLLLTLVACVAVGSSNIQCGMWSWLSGDNQVKQVGQVVSSAISTGVISNGVISTGLTPSTILSKEKIFTTCQGSSNELSDYFGAMVFVGLVLVASYFIWKKWFLKVPANKKVDALVGWVAKNNLFMNDVSFLVDDDIKNHVYQFRVEQQDTNSCGPRALFYAKMMSEFFGKNGVDLKILQDCLITGPGLVENPKLRQFFNEIFDKKIVSNEPPVFDENFVSSNEYCERPPDEMVDGELVFDEQGEVCNDGKRSKAGLLDPVNFQSEQLEKCIKKFAIKQVSVIDGYDSLVGASGLVGTMDCGFVEGQPRRFTDGKGVVDYHDGSAHKRNIGYFNNFIITEGENERSSYGLDSLGHWFCIFGVKIADKEYAWFIIDSQNKDFFSGKNQIKATAYIHKLLGSDKYKEYDNIVAGNIEGKEVVKEYKIFGKFKKNIENILKDNSNPEQKNFIIDQKIAVRVRKKYKIKKEKGKLKGEYLCKWLEEESENLNKLARVAKKDKEELGEKVRKVVAKLS